MKFLSPLFLSALTLMAAELPAADRPLSKIRVQLDWVAEPEHGGFYQAQERGFFAEEGLEVSQVFGERPTDTIPAALAGKVDFGYSGTPPVLAATANGAGLVAIGVFSHGYSGILVASKANANLKTLADFRGKRLGMQRGTGVTNVFLIALERSGLKESDFQISNLRIADMPTAMQGGSFDAVLGWDVGGANIKAARVQPNDPGEPQVIDYPFLYYLLEVRRGGKGWWNATIIISRRQQVVSQPTPEPEPEVVTGPAFRGPAPEAPVPEPVLDASGGVAGGSDYQGTAFGGAPVVSAPVVAAPVAPPAAARFPSFPPEATSAPGVGTAVARGTSGVEGPTAGGVRTAGPRQQAPVGTVKAMSGQAPRRGYTDYLRSPALPQLAGAAIPGVAGILLMTLGGLVIGYRQASAGRMIRAGGAARYLP